MHFCTHQIVHIFYILFNNKGTAKVVNFDQPNSSISLQILDALIKNDGQGVQNNNSKTFQSFLYIKLTNKSLDNSYKYQS